MLHGAWSVPGKLSLERPLSTFLVFEAFAPGQSDVLHHPAFQRVLDSATAVRVPHFTRFRIGFLLQGNPTSFIILPFSVYLTVQLLYVFHTSPVLGLDFCS